MIKQIKSSCLVTLLLISLCSCEFPDSPASSSETTAGDLQGAVYLGLEPPGMTAEIFLPDFLADVERGTCSGFLINASVFVFKLLSPERDWKFEPVYITEFKDGAWTEPSVTPDGKYFFFTSDRSGAGEIYWVSTKILLQYDPR